MTLFLALVVGHCLCDYPLQGDFLARGKNHMHPIPGVPWYQCLLAHAAIQGGMVALVTGSTVLGVGEFIVHTAIDFFKSDGNGDPAIAFDVDQALHIGCKAAWAAMVWWTR